MSTNVSRFTLPRNTLTFRALAKQANEIVTDGLVIIGRSGKVLTTAANEDALGEATVDVLQQQFDRLRGDDEFTFLTYHQQVVLVVKNLLQDTPRATTEQAQRLAALLDARDFSTHTTVVIPNGALPIDAEHAVGSRARLQQLAHKAAAPLEAFIYGLQLGDAAYRKLKTNSQPRPHRVITLFGDSVNEAAIIRANTEAFGALLMKELVALPPNLLGTAELRAAAEALTEAYPDITLDVLTTSALEAKGFGLLTAVGKASNQPTLVLVLRYNTNPSAPLTALVGKGLVYDTGGINLKPNGGRGMKGDMAGAALVLGTLASLAANNASANVVGVIGAVANDIGPDAYRPDDVLTAYNGKTVEIDNTDAEGRLVLADCLTYAARDLNASRIVSIATLTAVERAIGTLHAGIFTENGNLLHDFQQAEQLSGEAVWQLPMMAEMMPTLDSNVADFVNTKGDPLVPSPIRGALFLHQFVDRTPYLHMDIGGVIEPSRNKYVWGVRLLSRLLAR